MAQSKQEQISLNFLLNNNINKMPILPDKEIRPVPIQPTPEPFQIPKGGDVSDLILDFAKLQQNKQAQRQKALTDLSNTVMSFAELQQKKEDTKAKERRHKRLLGRKQKLLKKEEKTFWQEISKEG